MLAYDSGAWVGGARHLKGEPILGEFASLVGRGDYFGLIDLVAVRGVCCLRICFHIYLTFFN